MKYVNDLHEFLYEDVEAGMYNKATLWTNAILKYDSQAIKMAFKEIYNIYDSLNDIEKINFIHCISWNYKHLSEDFAEELIKKELISDNVEIVDMTINLIEQWMDMNYAKYLYGLLLDKNRWSAWIRDYAETVLKDIEYEEEKKSYK